jgi:hypothetical protein
MGVGMAIEIEVEGAVEHLPDTIDAFVLEMESYDIEMAIWWHDNKNTWTIEKWVEVEEGDDYEELESNILWVRTLGDGASARIRIHTMHKVSAEGMESFIAKLSEWLTAERYQVVGRRVCGIIGGEPDSSG